MNATKATTPETDLLSLLAGGLGTETADNFLDQAFALAGRFGSIDLSLVDNRVLRFQPSDSAPQELEVQRAKSKLRMLCARLAVRCGEYSNQPAALYGGTIALVFPPMAQRFNVHFENTAATQRITARLPFAFRTIFSAC